MRFGICTTVENAPAVKRAGWDFVELLVQPNLQGLLTDSEWRGAEHIRSACLPIPAANALVPPELKVTGPQASLAKLAEYMGRVIPRAAASGIRTLVFGSGAARMVPDGFDRAIARRQIVDFVRMSCEIAARQDVLLVAEHLNKGECNIINSVAEAMEYVRELNHPNFQCLVDAYHFWLEHEPLDSLREAMPFIRHVHMADTEGRVACGATGKNDYRSFFGVLKRGGYDGLIAMESFTFTDIEGAGPGILEFLKREWELA